MKINAKMRMMKDVSRLILMMLFNRKITCVLCERKHSRRRWRKNFLTSVSPRIPDTHTHTVTSGDYMPPGISYETENATGDRA